MRPPRTKLLGIAAGIVVLGLVGAAAVRWLGPTAAITEAAGPAVPTARVTRGDLTLVTHLQGELRATKQMNLTVPSVGGALRILTLVETGTPVEKDEVVMELDPADQQYALEQAESELREAEQEIIKRRADIKAQESQDQVTLLTAQFDVRRAELDALVDADLISANEHQIRQAELREAKRNLEKVEQDVKARMATNKASLSVLDEKRKRSEMAATRARQNMDNLVLRAPIAGIVAVRENYDTAGGYFYEGMAVPSYRAGDNVYSGRPVADIFDLGAMEIRAKVNEQERGNVKVGQTATVDTDAVAGLAPEATVSAIADLGRPDTRSGPYRLFDVTLELKNPDPRLRPGTTVRIKVQGETIKGVLLLPRQALFQVEGKPTVYVRGDTGDGYSPRAIKVLHRGEDQVAVEGLPEGVEASLVDPVAAMKLAAPGAAAAGPLAGKK
jgi:HlyD family secretion protein